MRSEGRVPSPSKPWKLNPPPHTHTHTLTEPAQTAYLRHEKRDVCVSALAVAPGREGASYRRSRARGDHTAAGTGALEAAAQLGLFDSNNGGGGGNNNSSSSARKRHATSRWLCLGAEDGAMLAATVRTDTGKLTVRRRVRAHVAPVTSLHFHPGVKVVEEDGGGDEDNDNDNDNNGNNGNGDTEEGRAAGKAGEEGEGAGSGGQHGQADAKDAQKHQQKEKPSPRAGGADDVSGLVLSASMDWSVKLWRWDEGNGGGGGGGGGVGDFELGDGDHGMDVGSGADGMGALGDDGGDGESLSCLDQ